MPAILVIGKFANKNTFLRNLAPVFGTTVKRFPQNSAALGYSLEVIATHQFYGVTSSSVDILQVIQRQCTCVINLIESVFEHSGEAETVLFGKSTYTVYLHEFTNQRVLQSVKAWIERNNPQQLKEAEDELRKDWPNSPPPPPFLPKRPDPSVLFQKKLAALQADVLQMKTYITNLEQEKFQGIQTQFHQAQNLIRPTNIQLAPVLKDWSSTSPILKTFGTDIKSTRYRTSITFTEPEFVFLMNILQTTVRQIIEKYYHTHTWKNYGKYFSKTSSGIPGGHKSFLIFTKAHEPDAFYILVRSNIHISSSHSSQTAEGDMLWGAGSTKKIKLYGLLLKFRLTYPNLIPDPISPVNRIVTFTWPTSLTLSKSSTTKIQRVQAKSVAMQQLLSHPKDKREFSNWDGLLSFSFGIPPVQKILAYQIFGGQSFDRTQSVLNNLSYDQKLYAILSLLAHLKIIICEQHTWPSDIKLQNIAYSVTSAGLGYYILKFIDFTSRVSSYTMLFNAQVNYLHLIFPPSLVTTKQFNNYMHQLDNRDATLRDNSTRLKIVAYHLCFELVLSLFFIMNDAVRNSYKGLFFYNRAWIQEPNLVSAIDTELNKKGIPHPPVNEMPFFSTLVKYAYHQNFFTDASKTVFDVLQEFFEVLRTEIQTKIVPTLITGPRISPHIDPLSDDENQILSNRWIYKISSEFQNIKNTPSPATAVQIIELENI